MTLWPKSCILTSYVNSLHSKTGAVYVFWTLGTAEYDLGIHHPGSSVTKKSTKLNEFPVLKRIIICESIWICHYAHVHAIVHLYKCLLYPLLQFSSSCVCWEANTDMWNQKVTNLNWNAKWEEAGNNEEGLGVIWTLKKISNTVVFLLMLTLAFTSKKSW